MNDRNGYNSRERSELPPPRFDERAHLRAQPVMPIRERKLSQFFEKLFANGSRSLALIVILGFLTGALIGVSLVGQNTSAPEASDQALALPQENHSLQLQDAAVGVYGIQSDGTNIRSVGSRRTRVPNNGQPRAYRFAVIR
jgi:hypothetical protein